MKKKLIIPTILVATIAIAGLLSVKVILAQEITSYPPIVQRIAQRFNLPENEVQEVFQEVWDERQAERYANWEDKLNDAVSEGKITQEQKQAILDKYQEMQDKMESLDNLSPEERRDEMHKLHDELRDWAEKEGIEFFPTGPFGMGLMHGFHKGMMGMN